MTGKLASRNISVQITILCFNWTGSNLFDIIRCLDEHRVCLYWSVTFYFIEISLVNVKILFGGWARKSKKNQQIHLSKYICKCMVVNVKYLLKRFYWDLIQKWYRLIWP